MTGPLHDGPCCQSCGDDRAKDCPPDLDPGQCCCVIASPLDAPPAEPSP